MEELLHETIILLDEKDGLERMLAVFKNQRKNQPTDEYLLKTYNRGLITQRQYIYHTNNIDSINKERLTLMIKKYNTEIREVQELIIKRMPDLKVELTSAIYAKKHNVYPYSDFEYNQEINRLTDELEESTSILSWYK